MMATAWFGMALAAALAAQPGVDARPDPSPIPRAAAGVAATTETPYRTDTVVLPLAGSGEDSEIEFAVHATAGDILVYSWEVEGLPAGGEFYTDFKGLAAAQGQGGAPAGEVEYREGLEARASGSLTSPFDGSHGWLFKNNSGRPVKVKLTIAGFYALPSIRESMGLEGPEYIPFGPPDWPDRYGPVQNRGNGR